MTDGAFGPVRASFVQLNSSEDQTQFWGRLHDPDVEINFERTEKTPFLDFTQQAVAFVQSLPQLLPRVRYALAAELLELYNDEWRDEGLPPSEYYPGSRPPEPVLDAAGFLARVRLESISWKSDGRYEFYFDDGDLFAGHGLFVNGDASGPNDVWF